MLETFLRANYPNATVIGFDDKPTSYLALKTGKIDAILTLTDSLMALKNRDLEDGPNMKVLDDSIYPTLISFIVKKGEQAFLDQANGFLANTERSGQGQKIWDKWFGPDTVYKMNKDFVLGTPANP